MPLSQHDAALDYDGSWADASNGWPEITLRNDEEGHHAHHVAWKYAKVPYGCYVLVGRVLRLETCDQVKAVREALKLHPLRRADNYSHRAQCKCGYGPGWAGLPECQQAWAGDPAYRPKYEHCILRRAEQTASDKGQG